jgi:hypothetical protein
MYVRHSPLNVLRRAIVVVGRQAGRHYQSLLVVVLAQDLVVVQVKPVAHAKPANLFQNGFLIKFDFPFYFIK